jgi:hypothetical protein
MFDVTVAIPQFADYSGFRPIGQAIIDRSSAFDGPVYLFNGDSHVYNTDQPLVAGSSWMSFYESVAAQTTSTGSPSTGRPASTTTCGSASGRARRRC